MRSKYKNLNVWAQNLKIWRSKLGAKRSGSKPKGRGEYGWVLGVEWLRFGELAFFLGGGQQAAAPLQEARTKSETHTVMNHWWWLNTHELREAIIQKKIYFAKKFHKRGGGQLDFMPLFFYCKCPQNISFRKTPTGGGSLFYETLSQNSPLFKWWLP